MDNDIEFNKKLVFSWWHIFSGIALIAIAYCTFVGTVYLLKGQFLISGIITAVITLLIALLFFVPQQLKATDNHFERCLKWERALIFSSPLLFIALMIPFAHAWTVHSRQDQILDSFSQVLSSSSELFDNYESYSNIRILNYKHTLGISPEETPNDISKANKIEVLRLTLLSSNYDSLKNIANAWMTKATSEDLSTWNIFLLGNITEIQEALHSWHDDLRKFSETKLSDEEDVRVFDSSSQNINDIDLNISQLTAYYTDIKGFSPMMILWLLLGYAMMMLPYLFQSRHTKTTGTSISLFGGLKKSADKNDSTKHTPSPSSQKTPEQKTNNNNKDDYGPIRL